jgi:hypothetical protein
MAQSKGHRIGLCEYAGLTSCRLFTCWSVSPRLVDISYLHCNLSEFCSRFPWWPISSYLLSRSPCQLGITEELLSRGSLIAGPLWWYFLCRTAEKIADALKERRKRESLSQSDNSPTNWLINQLLPARP